MGYRSRLNVVECKARMRAKDVGKAQRILKKHDVGVESCFLEYLERAAGPLLDEGLGDSFIEIPEEKCHFFGNHVSDESIALIASLITGKLSGYFVGEDGCEHGGFEITDGKLALCDVVVTLRPKVNS